MSDAVSADARDRARAVRGFLRARRTRFRPTAYQVYATLVVGGIAGALAGNAVSEAIGGSLTAHKLLVFGPVVLFLGLLAALRFGTWQGPVGFSSADVGFLLTAPIAIAAFVRPKLDQSLVIGAVVGAAVAGVAILLIPGGPGSVGLVRALGAVAGVAGFAVLAVAASWLVESSRRASGLVRRASPAVLVIGAALLAISAAAIRPFGWSVVGPVGMGDRAARGYLGLARGPRADRGRGRGHHDARASPRRRRRRRGVPGSRRDAVRAHRLGVLAQLSQRRADLPLGTARANGAQAAGSPPPRAAARGSVARRGWAPA